MPTTLLSLAVAIILALVTALVGPLLVDWGRYRVRFEAEASRLVGTPVHVSGAIDVRLLPVPSLTLHGIETGASGEPKLRAPALRVEFALGPLVRGEWHADELRIDGAEITLGLDAAGRIAAPAVAIGFDPDQFSIERLAIENAHVAFVDGASGGRVVLDKVTFRGDLRSLLGPIKGDGAFQSAGLRYGYHIAGGRRGEDGGMKLRLVVDPVDRPLALETEGTLWINQALPRFDGTFTLSRPAGLATPDGRTLASVPWRAGGRIRGTPAAALIEQLDFQYGPEENAIKLAGTAALTFGSRPHFDGVLSARQIDIDRFLVSEDGARRPPAATLRALADTLSESVRPPLPVKLGVSVDSLTFAGGPLQAVRGNLRIDGGTLDVEDFEFRAPGISQVRLSGQLTATGRNLEFVGPANLDSADPRALLAWLEGRPDATRITTGALRARGDMTIGSERIAVERLRAEFDRRTVEGRLAYVYPTPDRPAQLDAAVSAAEFDLDGAIAFAGNALAGASFDRPGEIALALDFGKATYAGVEARNAKAKLKFDSSGLQVEQLSLVGPDGLSVSASGRIDTASAAPRGAIAMTIDARRLDGAAQMAGRFAPRLADAMQGLAGRAAATRLNARLEVGSSAAGAADTKTPAKLHVDGALGSVRVDVSADVAVSGGGDLAALSAADIDLDGRLESDDGASLARLIGLDRYVVVDKRPARLSLRAKGALDSALQLDGRFDGAGLDATGAGSLRIAGNDANGTFDIAMSAADVRLLRRDAAPAVAVNLRTRLVVAGDALAFDEIRGSVAGSALTGRLRLALGRPLHVDGRIDADRIDAAAILAAGFGMPVQAAAAQPGGWASEPFAPRAFADTVGRVEFSARLAAFTPALAAQQVHGVAVFEPSATILESIDGRLADGRMSGQADLRVGSAGSSVQCQFALSDADLAQLLPKNAQSQASGRVTLQLQLDGTGRSPAALVGDLKGSGTVAVEGLLAAGLDPAAIGAAIRAGDQGVALDAIRIGDIVRAALDRGRLNVPWAGGAFTVSSGRLDLGTITAPARDADVVASGALDLSDRTLDLRFTLTGAPRADAPAGQRPEMQVALKGPIDAARRSVDVTALLTWLTMRSVEQEAKRIDMMESEARRLDAIRRARAAIDAGAPPPAGSGPTTGSLPLSDKVPPLPPPIDIRPAPGLPERSARKPAVIPPAKLPTLPPRVDSVPTSAFPAYDSR